MTMKPGPLPKLTQEEQEEAIKLYNEEHIPLKTLAAIYDVSIRTIWLYIHDPGKEGM